MLGVGIVNPVLPLYARSFGASYALVGFVVSGFGIGRILSDAPTGILADRIGRKPMLLTGIIVFMFASLIGAFALNIAHLIVMRFVQGIGAAMFTTSAMVLVGDVAPVGQRGRYLGYFNASFWLGTITGPVIGGLLVDLFGFSAPFLALSVLCGVAGVHTHLRTEETMRAVTANTSRKFDFISAVNRSFRSPTVSLGFISSFAIFFVNSALRFTALPLYAAQRANLGPGEIGIILGIGALASLLVILPSAKMIDRYGSVYALVIGFGVAALSSFSFIVMANFYGLAVSAFIFGFSTGILQPARATIVIEAAEPEHRGFYIGFFRLFGDLGLIAGPAITGFIADQRGLPFSFTIISLVCIVMAVLTWRVELGKSSL